MHYGTIVKFDPEKQFGWITSRRNPKLFFHISAIEDDIDHINLMPGTSVAFEIGADPKGRPCALEIRRFA